MSYTLVSIEKMRAKSVADFKRTKQVLKSLHTGKSQRIDQFFQQQHEAEFSRINCLECANCCKSISPGMHHADIRRMASFLKIKEQEVLEKYLRLDEEGEYVFRSTPCPFLGEDNYCRIYPARPRACREYPHTNQKRIIQILDLTGRNSKICPAVHNIIETLKKAPIR